MVYAPGTLEKDPKKQNIALQRHAAGIATNTTDIATNTADIATHTADIATNTADIATNASNISSLQTSVTTLQTPGTGLGGGGGSSLSVSLSKITASLSGDVALNNTSNYFDGPSIAQGSSGTWFVSGSVTLQDTSGGATFTVKLWDGTTVIASGVANTSAASGRAVVHLSGYMASPAGNLRISASDGTSTNGKILANNSANLKDSTISAFRIG
jgi:hypothetical protein